MAEQPTVSVLTLGCKLNQADAEAVARRLIAGGVRVVGRPEKGGQAFVRNTSPPPQPRPPPRPPPCRPRRAPRRRLRPGQRRQAPDSGAPPRTAAPAGRPRQRLPGAPPALAAHPRLPH